MSHDEEGPGHREPIILTSPKRFGKGLAIIGITIAIGAAILIPNFNEMIKNPPPVTRLGLPTTVEPKFTDTGSHGAGSNSSGGGNAIPAGATTISILKGASVQGSKAYDPDPGSVPANGQLVFSNKDTAVHTATSGKGSDDPNSGKIFDTGFVNPGKNSKAMTLTGAKQGDTIPYYCQVHPFMKGTINVAAPSAGGASGSTSSTPAAEKISILKGASVQGSPAYDPDSATAKKGDIVEVDNTDNAMHTLTSGTGSDDPNSGKAFDTSYIQPGKSATITLDKVDSGTTYPFYCQVHPFMKGSLKVS
ncbi:MAG: cupredoxin domain-containing protein [Nitrososphaera sp.]|jgi:plastocyanin